MKNKNIFLAIVATVMTIASCAKIESTFSNRIPTNSKGEYAILFGDRTLETKAAINTTAGNGYDEFSLFGWNALNDTIMNPFTVQANGANSYVYEEVNGQKLQYFKNNTDSYSFIGIIPTTDAKVKNGAVKVGVESFVVDDNRVSGTLTADSPKEFLWARADVVKANYGSVVNLPFKHGNALLYLGFISDDGNTQIVDYTPYTPATSGQAAYDEDVVTYTYSVTIAPSAYQGPLFASSAITQEDIDYVNSKYSASKPWSATMGSSTFNGDLNENMWEYLVSKHPSLASEDVKQWATTGYQGYKTMESPYMRLVHMEVISGSGDSTLDGCIRGWFVNVANMSNTPQEVHTTVHHDAIPATPASGFKGIRVFSAKVDATDGYAHLAHTKTADAIVATALTFDNRIAVTDSILFSLPTGVIPVGTTEAQAVYSPTTFYAIPGDEGLTHFVVKLSYTYKGTTVYDVRVPIVLPATGLEAGKYYKYIINITSTANGTNNPDEANNEKDDIDITDNPIQATIDVTDYTEGHTQIVTI